MRRAGFTLVELVVVLTLVGLLASIGLRSSHDMADQARVARAIAEIRALESTIAASQAETGVLPATLAAAGAGAPLDPWGEPYVYQPLGDAMGTGKARKDRFMVPLNSDFDLYSKGRDRDSQAPLTTPVSRDDIIRAGDGQFVGLAEDF